MTDPIVLVAAFVIGACVGSFLNVCIARWPANESVVAPRSRCPRCGHQITWLENIPIVSWLALRARCRGCGQPISAIYPAVELIVALGWLAAFAAFGPTFTALRVAVFGTVLLGIFATDLRHYLIPDGFTVFGLAWGIVAAVVAVATGDPGPFAPPWDAFIGACAGAGAIAIAGWLGEVALKKEAMGFGDVTLMAVVGAALGPGRALLTIFIGALLGAVAFLAVVYPVVWLRSRRGGAPFEPPLVPFGVFLAPAAMVTLLWGYALLDWYRARAMVTG
ncbi:MAG TPA: prepilin peptidase [Gemmatimonadaceae bacterium]|nr:prepilin peptidase [Gemmatimonadaceae bacterium]